MKELIDKAAIIAEIRKRGTEYPCDNSEQDIGYHCALYEMQDFLNTLETKVVDLEKEFDKYCENLYVIDIQEAPFTEMYDCAKYFFELGLKSQKGE